VNGFVLCAAQAPLDGGTIYLRVRASDETYHLIHLTQRVFLGSLSPQALPGRLYWDGSLVPIRSPLERDILAKLRASTLAEEPTLQMYPPAVSQQPPEASRQSTQTAESRECVAQFVLGCSRQLVTFVESVRYLHLACRVMFRRLLPWNIASLLRESSRRRTRG